LAEKSCPKWEPRSEVSLNDQLQVYDQVRRRCAVAHSEYLHWSLFRHADVMRVLQNPEVFSNVISSHLAIPNGMDPPEHTEYRRIIDKYFSPERITEFDLVCRNIAAALLSELSGRQEIELAAELADLFAIRIQCAFLDWPATLHAPLLQWTRKNHAAILSGDKQTVAAVATEFDGYIRGLLAQSRNRAAAEDADPMARLLNERLNDRSLADDEIVSILRNWTVGELSTISACVGILAHYLAEHEELQCRLRETPSLLPKAIDEILRIHPPLISSRRKATQSVAIDGCLIPAGERVTIMWASANRDEHVFGDPDEFRLDRDPAQNLLYGAGIHVCPGAPLARLELRVLLEELLRRSRLIVLASGKRSVRALYPGSGFSSLPVRIDWTV
jgi:cytochrome P450